MRAFGKIYTALAVVAYLALATPVEAIVWYSGHQNLKYANWILLLNSGSYLVAIVMLVFTLALKAFSDARQRTRNKEKPSHERGALIALGGFSGWVTSVAWWYGFRFACKHAGLEDQIIYGVGGLEGGISFYQFYSVFIALFLAIVAADMVSRWPWQRQLSVLLPSSAAVSMSEFIWVLWLAWLILYRLSEWVWLLVIEAPKLEGYSLAEAYGGIIPLAVTSIASIPIALFLFLRKPKTRKSSIAVSILASFLIPLGGAALIFRAFWLALGTLALSVVTLNFAGLVWGWMAGDLRWRSLQAPRTGPAVGKP